MKDYHNHTAILFFSNTVEAELREKQFLVSSQKRRNRKLAGWLIAHNLKICKASALALEVVDSTIQRGETFAERLKHAFEDVFAKGYKNIIAIGSDCLELSSKELIQAKDFLTQGKSVLGPSKDGGIYLLGLNSTQFKKLDFATINWKTNQVFTQLYTHLGFTQNGEVLGLKTDLDRPEDLILLANSKRIWLNQFWIHLIISTVLSFNRIFHSIRSACFCGHKNLRLLRGPPHVISF